MFFCLKQSQADNLVCLLFFLLLLLGCGFGLGFWGWVGVSPTA